MTTKTVTLQEVAYYYYYHYHYFLLTPNQQCQSTKVTTFKQENYILRSH